MDKRRILRQKYEADTTAIIQKTIDPVLQNTGVFYPTARDWLETLHQVNAPTNIQIRQMNSDLWKNIFNLKKDATELDFIDWSGKFSAKMETLLQRGSLEAGDITRVAEDFTQMIDTSGGPGLIIRGNFQMIPDEEQTYQKLVQMAVTMYRNFKPKRTAPRTGTGNRANVADAQEAGRGRGSNSQRGSSSATRTRDRSDTGGRGPSKKKDNKEIEECLFCNGPDTRFPRRHHIDDCWFLHFPHPDAKGSFKMNDDAKNNIEKALKDPALKTKADASKGRMRAAARKTAADKSD